MARARTGCYRFVAERRAVAFARKEARFARAPALTAARACTWERALHSTRQAVTVVVLSAIVPTAIAQRWFSPPATPEQPHHLVPPEPSEILIGQQ
jgi:hypothetical protein